MSNQTTPADIAGHADSHALDQDYASQLTVKASAAEVFDALATLEGLAAWWTPVTGNGLAGGELTFTFGPGTRAVMRVDDAERATRVRWTNLDCHVEDWVGTEVHFDIEARPSGGAEVRFRHVGLTPKLECFDDCKSGWDHFLPSLRAYLDTGTGNPWMSEADVARRAARGQLRASAAAG